MTQPHSPSPEHHPKTVAVEPDVVHSGKMFILLALLALAVAGSCVVVWQFFRGATSREIESKVHAGQGLPVAEKDAAAQRELDSYGQIDAKKGIYRIPIKRAMAMLVANPKLLEPQPAPPKAAPPPKKAAPPPAKKVEPEAKPGAKATTAAKPIPAKKPTAAKKPSDKQPKSSTEGGGSK